MREIRTKSSTICEIVCVACVLILDIGGNDRVDRHKMSRHLKFSLGSGEGQQHHCRTSRASIRTGEHSRSRFQFLFGGVVMKAASGLSALVVLSFHSMAMVSLLLLLPSSHCFSTSNSQSDVVPTSLVTPVVTRRVALATGLLGPVFGAVLPSLAFDNGIPDMEKYKDKDKFPGTQPDNLGLGTNGKLAECDESLNCFSTSGNEDHLLPRWKAPSKKTAMTELVETVRAYPPGQARVDKGGFSIVTENPEYLYVQFESMKHGFIDDVEFALSGGSEFQVRSSSRIGDLDLGVNAKRLNWISKELRTKGWNAPEINKDTHPDYFNTYVFTFDDYIRSILYPKYCPVPANPLECKDPPNLK